ncbi:MAG: hypothetical protein JRI38_08130 [Deltaproteobacteria bacterium]|nr:hypothetical protein [Deltaproteobacteria bacterium]
MSRADPISINVRERVISAIPVSKWKLNGKKRAFKNALIFGKQTINDPNALPKLLGKYGWYHLTLTLKD